MKKRNNQPGFFTEKEIQQWAQPYGTENTIKNGKAKVSAATPIKHKLVEGILDRNIRCTQAIINKHKMKGELGKYHYFDITAGPEPGEKKCSALIFLEMMRVHWFKCAQKNQTPMSFHAVFIEIDSERIEDLKNRVSIFINKIKYLPLQTEFKNSIEIIKGDHCNILPEFFNLNKSIKGLIYNDPWGKASFELLAEVSKIYKRIDMLINCNCTIIKRLTHNPRIEREDYCNLITYLSMIEKDHIICNNELLTGQQWLMTLLTNWGKHPTYDTVGLTPLHQEKWDILIEKANYTNKEIKKNGRTNSD